MKVSRAGLLSLIVVAAAALSAQTATSSAPGSHALATLSGLVTKDPGNDPVKKALIELIAESPSDGGNYTAITGADGGFHVENISPGRYRLFVERSGYQEINRHRRNIPGRVLTLNAGQEMKDLVIRLQAAAVVEGRVTDEDGDPMPEAQVAVLRQTFVAGRSHWEQAGAERTNDLGEYRIPSLPAGSYFVSVTPPPDFRSLIETSSKAPAVTPRGEGASDKPASASYQTTYYPGTRDRGQAAPIQLHPGDDFPLNFSLTPSPSLTIRGSVVSLPSGSGASIMLQSKDFSLVLNGAEMHKDGTFEIRDVSPGAYTIMATVDDAPVPMMARQTLQVGSANVDGLRLAPQTGGTIRGHLRMEAGRNTRPDLSQMFLLLRSADGDDDIFSGFATGLSTVAHVNADGSFEWKNVPAGHYSVQISDASAMPDWFLKSIAAGGRDASGAEFSIHSGVTTLDLLASANGATAEGVATNPNDELVADAMVVAVPEARFRGHSDRYRSAVTDQRGRFILRGLPPGDYTLFAWESVDGEAYYNPEFLKSFEGQGRALHVAEGDRVSLPLKAIPAVEDQP